ncbi:soma ferritin-like [Dendronephthya gigantea]|uniref:soma ferritin-like n=1 Tax=Dendronephthya gigantea TaxID=151771 RepID=UPI00106D76DD|nr:soma ferritin-like [Dendronephthya gigantea]XP_028401566.1 soma ferritin-like [Dendronephthya gigantea]XP_028401568.1 soma ferritin-like [Dendronephthya gigantea]
MFQKLVVLLCVVCSQMVDADTTNCSINNCTNCFIEGTKKDAKDIGPKFDAELECGVNRQINYELSAHYTYLSMSYHFDQYKYYLPGFSKYFKKMAEEEHEHAQMFMKYQNKRGGQIRLGSIPKPCCEDEKLGKGKDEKLGNVEDEKLENSEDKKLGNCDDEKWKNGAEAMKAALQMEQFIDHSLQDLHNKAHEKDDAQFQDFLETNFLGEQVDSIKQISDYYYTLKRIGTPLGEFQFDKLVLGGGKDTEL